MLPESTKTWLNEFDFPEYREAIRQNREATKKHLADVGIHLDSDIAEFYLNYGALTATGWYELLEPMTLRETADYVHSDFDIPTHYLPLTAHEGGGFSLLNLNSDQVYDLVFDQIDDLIAGTLGRIFRRIPRVAAQPKQSQSLTIRVMTTTTSRPVSMISRKSTINPMIDARPRW